MVISRVVIKLLRPKQWIKNLLVFAPLIFAQELLVFENVIRSVFAFIAFCFLSSCMYVVNDIYDCELDKAHPIKSKRPLPSGRISSQQAWIMALLLGALGLILAWYLGRDFSLVAVIYLALILAYSVWFKHEVILDVLIVSVGFVLRALAGAVVIQVEFSPWLLVTTLFLALFLALGKRRRELILLADEAVNHRKILGEYSRSLLDQLIVMVATASLLSFTLYTLSSNTITKFGTTNLVYTLPLVIYGLFRYFYLVYRKDGGGDPTETLYTDLPLLGCVALWGILIIVIIYR